MTTIGLIGSGNIGGTVARPAGAPDRAALPIAADDAEAKRTVTAFLDAIGYDAVDAGPLSESWRAERDAPVYVSPYREGGPADAATIRALLDKAER
jgi:predicted dinucleotide-binding enzyme